MKKFTLSKAERLSDRLMIGRLLSDGNSFTVFPFRLFWLESLRKDNVPAQTVFSVPGKRFRKAVTRNLIRRRMKDAFRKNKYILYDSLLPDKRCIDLMYIYISQEELPYPYIEEKIILTLKQISAAYEKSH